MVQTTGNTHAGGASGGLFIVSKACMLLRVKKAEMPPTASGMMMQTINPFHCIFKMITPYHIYVIIVGFIIDLHHSNLFSWAYYKVCSRKEKQFTL